MWAEGGPVDPGPLIGNGDRETVVYPLDIRIACLLCGMSWGDHDMVSCTAKMAVWKPVGLFGAGG